MAPPEAGSRRVAGGFRAWAPGSCLAGSACSSRSHHLMVRDPLPALFRHVPAVAIPGDVPVPEPRAHRTRAEAMAPERQGCLGPDLSGSGSPLPGAPPPETIGAVTLGVGGP